MNDGAPPPRRAAATAPPVARLIEAFHKLPGIGPKGAQRIVFHLLAQDPEAASRIAASCESIRERVKICRKCHILIESDQGVLGIGRQAVDLIVG